MRNRDFDDFSFKAPHQSQQSIGELSSKDDNIDNSKKQQLRKDIRYRHLQSQNNNKPIFVFKPQINTKINKISQELEQNIKRRLQLEKKLNIVKENERKKQQRQIFMGYNNNTYKSHDEQAKQFNKINKKIDETNQLIKGRRQIHRNKQEIIQKNKEILLDNSQSILTTQKQHIIIPILQKITSKNKPMPIYTVPNQIKIQTLLRKATFPQIPNYNLQQLRKQVQNLFAVHSPHSDIHYLLMIIYFHLKKFPKVRKHFQQIINFKTFNNKVYWIAAQTQYELQNYDLCLKLTQDCINKLQQKYLPRFIYLKAKSYEEIGNYINSALCFNELIKMKPNICDYYLERGIIYHRIGYYKESKQDWITFGIMKPNAENYIKQKVLSQKNQYKKKEYISLLAKMF